MTEYSPKKNRALLVGAIYIGYALGGILASLIGMYLIRIQTGVCCILSVLFHY